MHKSSKSAFIATMALICYTGFATAQTVSFDKAGDLSTLVNDLKGGPGGPGGHGGFPGGPGGHGGGNVPTPPPPSHGGGFNNDHGNNGGFGHNDHGNNGGFGHDDHGNNGWDHNGHNDHNGPGPQPWHPQPGPQPGPWHPGPQPQPWNPGPQPQPWNPGPQPWHPGPQPQPWNPGPQPWHPGPQPGPWHPHHNGHPDWDHNDWNQNHWNNHGHDAWWDNYDAWWVNYGHPFSVLRTICNVNMGSAKGFIVEQSMPFSGYATFYYYNAFDVLISASRPALGVYSGGNGTPVFDFYNVPQQADHCFMAITR